MGEVRVADTSQEETQEGGEAGEVGGLPGEVGREEEVGQGGEGGEKQNEPPAVRAAVFQEEPLTVTQCHSDCPSWVLTRSELKPTTTFTFMNFIRRCALKHIMTMHS